MLVLTRRWIGILVTVWASAAGLTLDEVAPSQQMDAIMERVFPLEASAVRWEDVPWQSFEKVIVPGLSAAGQPSLQKHWRGTLDLCMQMSLHISGSQTAGAEATPRWT
jgi:hypothetical protein